jgi:hypothetical protein
MHLPLDPDASSAEDLLRSLGAVLDTIRARSILIRETGDGLMLRACVTASLRDRLDERWVPIERHLSPDDLARYRAEAIARRGSEHQAGPHERSLRMIGRHIDEQALVGVTLIQSQVEGAWMLWHGADPEAGPSLLVLEDDRLRVQDARQAAARVERERSASVIAAHAVEGPSLPGPRAW